MVLRLLKKSKPDPLEKEWKALVERRNTLSKLVDHLKAERDAPYTRPSEKAQIKAKLEGIELELERVRERISGIESKRNRERAIQYIKAHLNAYSFGTSLTSQGSFPLPPTLILRGRMGCKHEHSVDLRKLSTIVLTSLAKPSPMVLEIPVTCEQYDKLLGKVKRTYLFYLSKAPTH